MSHVQRIEHPSLAPSRLERMYDALFARLRRITPPTRWQPWVALGGACVVTALLGVHDPHGEGSYGYCPFKFLTGGLDDAGCGTLRAIHHLANGELSAALDDNAFTVVSLVLLGTVWVRWTFRTLRASPSVRLVPGWAYVVWFVAMGIFWVMRNLPYWWGPYLASG